MSYVAVEGLGNRLRTHLVAHAYAISRNKKFVVNWEAKKAFGAKFSDLFELRSFSESNIFLSNNFFIKLIRRNSFLKINGLGHLMENQTVEELPDYPARMLLFGEAFYPHACVNHGSVLGRFRERVIKDLVPRSGILKRIDELKSKFSEITVGFHIRRGDFHISFQEKILPITNYFEAARKILKINKEIKLFVASDDTDILKLFQSEFHCIFQKKGEREVGSDPMEVFLYDEKSNRDTKEGAIEALIDMWLLASTDLIVGSEHSSFSEMASLLGTTKFFIPTDENLINGTLEKIIQDMTKPKIMKSYNFQ